MKPIQPISSLQNPRIKQVVKLRNRRERLATGLMILEGADVIAMARTGQHPLTTIFWCPELAGQHSESTLQSLREQDLEIFEVSSSAFTKISCREHPDGWLALAPLPASDLPSLNLSANPLLVIVEGVEKPGNLGAILRTSEAAGVEALIVCDPATDIHNPNVVQASKGTLFSIPVVQATSAVTLAFLAEKGIAVAAATPAAQTAHWDAPLSGPIAIAVGTESTGLSQFWLEAAHYRVLIPMQGKVNSLNVATSAGLIIYEAIRQRR